MKPPWNIYYKFSQNSCPKLIPAFPYRDPFVSLGNMYSERFSGETRRETDDERAILGARQSCYGREIAAGGVRGWHESIEPSPQPVQNPSCVMLSASEVPASSFYAAENFMSFHRHSGNGRSDSCNSSQNHGAEDLEFPLYRSSAERLSVDTHDRRGTAVISSVALNSPSVEVSHAARQSLITHSWNQAPMLPNLFNKTRIRWTQDLHEKFIKCVNRLGGAEKATPKSILKLMDSDGLTIFHIKSHLQKYRMAKYVPYSAEERLASQNGYNENLLSNCPNHQIREALVLQLDVQQRLHEQLEIQKNLQVRIEEQSRKLKMMLQQQQKAKQGVSKSDEENALEEVRLAAEDGSQNTHFQSKIS